MPLNQEQREVLAAVADVLIPGGESMPSASQIDLAGTLIDQALRYRPEISDAFIAALHSCNTRDPAAALDALAETSPELLSTLTLLVSGAYLMSPEALKAMNYSAPPRSLVDDTNTYVDLLANVVDHGFEIR